MWLSKYFVNHCKLHFTDVLLASKSHISGEFNNASAFKRSLYWCQALHITNKDRYQSTSARRALALLNLPQESEIINVDIYTA